MALKGETQYAVWRKENEEDLFDEEGYFEFFNSIQDAVDSSEEPTEIYQVEFTRLGLYVEDKKYIKVKETTRTKKKGVK